MIEIREILRLWLQGRGLREVARLSGTDRKTVRRYVDRARACGLDRDGGGCQLTDELLAAVIAGVRPLPDEGRGEMRSVAEGTRLSRWPTVTWPCGAPASASSCSKRIIVVDEIRRDSSWWEDVF